jgi:nitrogen regulatory protein PII
MKLISCVIRPERLPAVKEALFRAGVTGITITRATGHGWRARHGDGEARDEAPPCDNGANLVS